MLGNTENLQSTKNQPLKSVRELFQTTEKLITEQAEITGLSTTDRKQLMWKETSPPRDSAAHISNSKTYVFCDSVLCLGSLSENPAEAWKDRVKWFLESRYLKDLDRIYGASKKAMEPMELEWTNFSRFTALGILAEIQKMMAESMCEPEQFKGRIIFMSLCNDIFWRERGNRDNCIANSFKIEEYARKFPQGRWSSLELGCEKKRYGTHTHKLDGEWDRTAESMMLNFAESGHPAFRATSALERGELRSKGKGKKSVHFNGSEETVELILRTVTSANQLSIYGTVADLCRELAKDSPNTRKHAEHEDWESMVVPSEFPNANDISQTENTSRNSQNFLNIKK